MKCKYEVNIYFDFVIYFKKINKLDETSILEDSINVAAYRSGSAVALAASLWLIPYNVV